MDEAAAHAEELLSLCPQFEADWNYGNAVHDGHLVLGRIAVREWRVERAKDCLLLAGGSPGSPQLDSFGPNTSLAEDLLDHGEREVVLEYFERCRRFWKLGGRELDEWSRLVRAGERPDFGPNLLY